MRSIAIFLFVLDLFRPPAVSAQATQLVVVTDPPGAAVFVDGRPVGPSPATLTELLPGEHVVTARTEDGRRSEQRVTLNAGHASVTELVFEPAPEAAPAPTPASVEPPMPEPPPAPAIAEPSAPVVDAPSDTPREASLGVVPSAVPGWGGATMDQRGGLAIGGGVTSAVGAITLLIGLAIGTDHDTGGFVAAVVGGSLIGIGAIVALVALMTPVVRGNATESGVRLGAIELSPTLALGPSGGMGGMVLRW